LFADHKFGGRRIFLIFGGGWLAEFFSGDFRLNLFLGGGGQIRRLTGQFATDCA